MLKNIRLHIEQDEVRQAEYEKQLAEHITVTSKENINAFQRHIPSLVPYFQAKTQNISIFCNLYGEINIVDYGLGRTLYGMHPYAEVKSHVERYARQAAYFQFDAEDGSRPQQTAEDTLQGVSTYRYYQGLSPLPEKVEVMVVLGLGLGYHIEHLLTHYEIAHLIVYEPEVQYFSCSLMALKWKGIFDAAAKKNTAIFLQLGKDGRDLLPDLEELSAHVPVNRVYFYQHYNHPVFNSVVEDVISRPWSEIRKNGFRIRTSESADEYCPPWTSYLYPYDGVESVHTDNARFKQNLEAFATYFPDIAKEFSAYKPRHWIPVVDAAGEVNLVNKKRLVTWYGAHPRKEGEENFEGFARFPHKDGLVLGYKGTKLKHYLHYQFVSETEELISNLEEEEGSLPAVVKSIILFGLGCGYQLETLFKRHEVEKIFICEPNRDFFYASLFAIDWQAILRDLDNRNARLYINIGDDGNHLFRDLLRQFYAIGPYTLNSTYFYQSYFNAPLGKAVSQLREQLQVVVSMGEYFDHAYYGIAHTVEGIKRGYPLLKKRPGQYITPDGKETPVFLVGNGPSLDFSIDAIKEYQDRAIIVSCGTSLQVLHRHGITPDFHAEIEQNRSTFDWACRIGDLAYLKNITLISCNGVHPDTASLYKDVYLAFKEGESSTVSTLRVLGEGDYEVLQFAFPTVTNFAMNLFCSLDMQQIYLIGVDLGFVDSKHHHSKHSGYYLDQQQPLYDYEKTNNTSLVVEGNFRRTVNTKHEFKIARMLIEQSLISRKIDCYNCADGAKIRGATPLPIDNMLLLALDDKKRIVDQIKDRAFHAPAADEFAAKYATTFKDEALANELKVFSELSQKPVTSVQEAEDLVEQQKYLLFVSYQKGISLLFYYLYGTTNYANSVLTRILYASNDHKKVIDNFNLALASWQKALTRIISRLQEGALRFDTSASFSGDRFDLNIRDALGRYRPLVCTDSPRFVQAVEAVTRKIGAPAPARCMSPAQMNEAALDDAPVIMIRLKDVQAGLRLADSLSKRVADSRIVVFWDGEMDDDVAQNSADNVSLLYAKGHYLDPLTSPYANDCFRYYSALCMLHGIGYVKWILPKIVCEEGSTTCCDDVSSISGRYYFYDCESIIVASGHALDNAQLLFSSGSRGRLLGKALPAEMLVSRVESQQTIAAMKADISSRFPFLAKEGGEDV